MFLRRVALSCPLLGAVVCVAMTGASLEAQEPAPSLPGDASPQTIGELPGDWTRRGDTGVAPLPGGMFALGVQYRVVYDASNLPGPGGTTADDTSGYDFVRQRVRLNLEAAPNESVGAFVQAEFRGGWGGSSPAASDPRGSAPTLNPFNRIADRGLRYTYVYWKPSRTQQLLAGILPVSDEFGDTLFSADWDWNAGGLAWLGGSDRSRWRLGALNMVNGVGSGDPDTISHDGTLILADFARRSQASQGAWAFDWGGHAYALLVQENLPLGGTKSVWFGPTVTLRKDDFALRLFGILNTGDLGAGVLASNGTVVSGFTDADAASYTGGAFRAELEKSFRGVQLRGQLVHTTGDPDGEVDNRFATPMALFGTSGYWAYTHILTANGPSDVNDFGVDIGNRGAGLSTAQVLGRIPIANRIGLDLAAGWFHASEPRNAGRDMGYEASGMLRINLAGPLNLDAGIAGAKLGKFFGTDPEKVYEIFARLQLQY